MHLYRTTLVIMNRNGMRVADSDISDFLADTTEQECNTYLGWTLLEPQSRYSSSKAP